MERHIITITVSGTALTIRAHTSKHFHTLLNSQIKLSVYLLKYTAGMWMFDFYGHFGAQIRLNGLSNSQRLWGERWNTL